MQLDNILIQNTGRIHTTESGAVRIKRNLGLETGDAVNWCKQKIENADKIIRKGKNWYVYADNSIITVNAHSYTIITAHMQDWRKMNKIDKTDRDKIEQIIKTIQK